MDLNRDSVLIAKQASKRIHPDIGLLINDPQRDIIILQDIKGSGITHHRYNYEELKDIKSTNQIISRGLIPKKYSYDEKLHLEFVDGQGYDLIPENISNKHGDDRGAEVVKYMFFPWREKLRDIINN